MEAVKNLKYIKNNWKPYKKWEKEQQEEEQRVNFLKELNPPLAEELKRAKNYGSTLVNAVNIMDQISINKSENAMIGIGTALGLTAPFLSFLGGLIGFLASKLSKSKDKTPMIAAFIGYGVSTIIQVVAMNFFVAYCSKMSTRIARYQTRNKELKDVRNFVVYNDEQIKQAKEKAKNSNEAEEDLTKDLSIKESLNPVKVYKKAFSTVAELKKDFKNYQTWHEKHVESEKNKIEKFKAMKLSDEQEISSQKDRDKILNTIKKLEISSNDYEINSQLVVGVTQLLIDLIGVGGGYTLSWAFNKLSMTSADKKMTATLKSLSSYSIPLGLIATIATTGILVKFSKESARIGRHKEKQELLNNPDRFVAFSDKEKQQVKDIPESENSKNTLMKILKKDIRDILGMKKDFYDYSEYKKTKLKEELKLQKALKDIPISKEQEQEAKKIQQQLFKAFETIDDKSESFVDDTNALVSAAASAIGGTISTLSELLTLKLFGKKIVKFTKDGKMPNFIEGFELTKHLNVKDIALIFIVPFAAVRLIMSLVLFTKAEINKKACKIGIMTAMKDLQDSKNFVTENQNTKPQTQKIELENKDVFKNFIKIN